MNSKRKGLINDRFKEMFYNLTKSGLIKSKSQLAGELGTYNHIISAILNGKRSPTLEQLSRLITKYNLDANYFFYKSPYILPDQDPREQEPPLGPELENRPVRLKLYLTNEL